MLISNFVIYTRASRPIVMYERKLVIGSYMTVVIMLQSNNGYIDVHAL